jgi:hypothetical protein
MEFYQFIRKHIPGLRVLPISTELYIPGVILDGKKLRMLGHCRDVLPDEPANAWEFIHSEASIVYGAVSASRKLNSGVKVLGIFSLGGGFSHDLSVSFEVHDIRGATLSTNQLLLQPKLNRLRRKDRRGRWAMINNNLVVLEAFFAAGFTAKFYRENQLMTRAELEQISHLRVEAGVDYDWKAGQELIITSNAKVPFGVRGFIV